MASITDKIFRFLYPIIDVKFTFLYPILQKKRLNFGLLLHLDGIYNIYIFLILPKAKLILLTLSKKKKILVKILLFLIFKQSLKNWLNEMWHTLFLLKKEL